MRLADRFIARQWHFPMGLDDHRPIMDVVARVISESPVLVADNVARYVDERGESELSDYPSLAPPWPAFWIEYPSTSGRQRRGVWVCEPAALGDMRNVFPEESLVPDGITDWHWVVVFTLMVETERGIWGPVGLSSLTLDENGVVIGTGASTAPAIRVADEARRVAEAKIDMGDMEPAEPRDLHELFDLSADEARSVYADLLEREAKLQDRLRVLTERQAEVKESMGVFRSVISLGAGDPLDDEWLHRALAPAYQAVAFLHCRNVGLDEVTPPAKVQAKRRRKGKEPLVRYHTLRLEVPRKVTGHGTGHEDGHKALHIVAGHFSHYGACCSNHDPHGLLFGRHEGIYWTPTHARGSETLGKVRTDFDLRVPA